MDGRGGWTHESGLFSQTLLTFAQASITLHTQPVCVPASVRLSILAVSSSHTMVRIVSLLTYVWRRSGGVACALVLQFTDVCLPRFFCVVCYFIVNEVWHDVRVFANNAALAFGSCLPSWSHNDEVGKKKKKLFF